MTPPNCAKRFTSPNFTAKNRACIQRGKAIYDRDGENNENYFIFCGETIFGFAKTPTDSFLRTSA